jgi:hypothetical protein
MTALRCTLASDVKQTPYEFRPDETKKSAFWLDDGGKGAVREAAAPAECRIECVADLAATPAASATPQQFYVGGFQLVSNAKMIEVYVNDDQYLTTCRGIPSGEHRPAEKGSDGVARTSTTTYYKAIFAVPGGPRSVRNVVLKLRSLAPKDQQVAHLVMMKLTARLAPDGADSQRATDASSTAPAPEAGASLPTSPGSQPSPVPAPSLIASVSTAASSSSSQPVESGRPPSDVDVQSAMLGLSLMLKGTEERVVRSTADKVCRELRPCFASMQAQLQSLSSAMTNQWNSIHTAMGQQQQLIERQQATLRQLAEQQSELKELLLLQRQRQRHDDSNVVPTEETTHGRVEAAQVELGTDACVRGYISSAGDAEDASGAVGDEVEAGEPGQHQEAAVDLVATVKATCPTTTDSAESHGLDPDARPEASLDEVLAQAFPVVPSEDEGSATATHAPSPQGAAPTVMRAPDLMDVGDDDPFGECAIVASTTSTSP